MLARGLRSLLAPRFEEGEHFGKNNELKNRAIAAKATHFYHSEEPLSRQ